MSRTVSGQRDAGEGSQSGQGAGSRSTVFYVNTLGGRAGRLRSREGSLAQGHDTWQGGRHYDALSPSPASSLPLPTAAQQALCPRGPPGGLCSVLLPPSLTSSHMAQGQWCPNPVNRPWGPRASPGCRAPTSFPTIQLPWLLPNITFDFITRHQ